MSVRRAPRALACLAGIALGCNEPARERVEATPNADSASEAQVQLAAKEVRAQYEAERRPAVGIDPYCGDADISSRCPPFDIEGGTYTVEIEKTGETHVERVRVLNDSARVVYDEDVGALVRGVPGGWLKLSARVLEQADGRPRGLLLQYMSRRPDQGMTAQWYRILVPRAGVLQPLAPSFGFGPVGLPRGSQSLSHRLLAGGRLVLSDYRRVHFVAYIPYRVNFDCGIGERTCVTLAPDSIAGLARFDVLTQSVSPDSVAGQPRFRSPDEDEHDHEDWEPSDTAVTVALFPHPAADRPQRVTIDPGETVQVLGAAGRIVDAGAGDSAIHAALRDDWLHIRVKGRTGWVHGADGFAAIAAVRKARPPGSHSRP